MPYDGPGVYQHYKGDRYRVLGLAIRKGVTEEDGAEIVDVVYETLTERERSSDEKLWTRRLDNFDGWVQTDALEEPRFTKLKRW